MTQDKRLGLVIDVNLVMVLGLLLVGLLVHSLGCWPRPLITLATASGQGSAWWRCA
jgi:hypothetical protein